MHSTPGAGVYGPCTGGAEVPAPDTVKAGNRTRFPAFIAVLFSG
ncbi:hypothetical protein [Arthrobacter sp. zg-Y919]|nr:hypothetical protein [Arthrobacter sp. zg-Y919]WIB02450.1 hypothetical protein QNO10_10830 [Arthrobacter sp. zg-Y919]